VITAGKIVGQPKQTFALADAAEARSARQRRAKRLVPPCPRLEEL
jgi:hypothetical protein